MVYCINHAFCHETQLVELQFTYSYLQYINLLIQKELAFNSIISYCVCMRTYVHTLILTYCLIFHYPGVEEEIFLMYQLIFD